MKMSLLITLLSTMFINSYSQKKAEFEMYFYFKDAIGERDTIFFRADSSIIDNISSNDDLNLEWGETIDNSPFDTILTVRAKSGFNIQGDFYQNMIHRSHDEGNQNGYAAPKKLAIFIYTKYWPVKMTWDSEYFKNHERLYGTYASSDVNMTQRYLFNNPRPWNRTDIACLSSDEAYEKVLLESVLFKNWELPYFIEHEVVSLGKVGICGIAILFGQPWLGICDTITNINNPRLNYLNIYPTIVVDKLTIENQFNYNLNGEIISIDGRIIHKFQISENQKYLDLNFLKQGIYIIKLSNDFQLKQCFKILKE